jgi:hypothetical protein
MSAMPIIFTHNGAQYTGKLSQVQGAGDTGVYHLMIDNYYRGRLRLSAFDNKWVFDGEFAQLAEGFGALLHLVHWIRSEYEQDQESLVYYLVNN